MADNLYAISYDARRQLEHRIFIFVSIVVLVYVLVALFMQWIFRPVRTMSDAMAPDLPVDSVELVTPLFANPHRGDVVLLRGRNESARASFPVRFVRHICRFVSAQQWQPFQGDSPSGNQKVLRRIVALPGDTIYLNNYVLYVRPKGEKQFLTEFELTESKYNVNISAVPVYWDFELGAAGNMSERTLADDQYFVLADNRLESADSRVWGAVRRSDIVARALLVYFPFNRMKLL